MDVSAAEQALRRGELGAAGAIARQLAAAGVAAGHRLLGAVAAQRHMPAKARRHYARAVALDAADIEAWFGLARTAEALGDPVAAADAFRRGLALQPSRDASLGLGRALLRLGRADEARAALQDSARQHDYPDMLNDLAAAHAALGEYDEALVLLRAAALMRPASVLVRRNLARAWLAMCRPDEAERIFRGLIEENPDDADAASGLGTALHRQGALDQAEACYRRALALVPGEPRYHTSLGINLLLRGRFTEGWAVYAGRQVEDQVRPLLAGGRWQGEPVDSLMLVVEQGFGDAVQFIRYAERARRRAGRVVLACSPDLKRLLSTAAGVDEVITDNRPRPDIAKAALLLDLPRLLGDASGGVPAEVPYLKAPPGCPVAIEGDGLRVGLAWAGRATHPNDRERTLPAAALEPLFAVPGVRWFGLQKWPPPAWAGAAPAGRLTELGPAMADFADTAAVMARLDLVICADTAVAHLAGALGKPVWVLLPPVPDWRWLTAGETSPWYPTMRLFRRRPGEDWTRAVGEVAEALSRIAPPARARDTAACSPA